MVSRLIDLQNVQSNAHSNRIEITDDEEDNLRLSNIKLMRSKLVNLGMKYAEFSTCAITQTRLERCYLRKAKFVNVDFTGSTFEDCDLENANFNSCNLRYVKFRNCKLNLKEILGCLPTEPNLKVALLKELRKNQLDLGDNKSSDAILVKIYDTEKELLLERVMCRTSYHRNREDLVSRTGALFNYIMLQMNDFIWGYGLKLSRLFRTAILMILMFGMLIYYFTDKDYLAVTASGNIHTKLNFWESLYASYTNFTTVGYGHYTPLGTASILLFAVENVLGLIFIGFLVSGVYRRIAK
ncbi:pentapeptide repeat-containing protein [Bacillus toyonensis]